MLNQPGLLNQLLSFTGGYKNTGQAPNGASPQIDIGGPAAGNSKDIDIFNNASGLLGSHVGSGNTPFS